MSALMQIDVGSRAEARPVRLDGPRHAAELDALTQLLGEGQTAG
jgi:hypothetical protein